MIAGAVYGRKAGNSRVGEGHSPYSYGCKTDSYLDDDSSSTGPGRPRLDPSEVGTMIDTMHMSSTSDDKNPLYCITNREEALDHVYNGYRFLYSGGGAITRSAAGAPSNSTRFFTFNGEGPTVTSGGVASKAWKSKPPLSRAGWMDEPRPTACTCAASRGVGC